MLLCRGRLQNLLHGQLTIGPVAYALVLLARAFALAYRVPAPVQVEELDEGGDYGL